MDLPRKKLKFMAPFTLGLACNVRHKLSVTASTKLYPLKIAYSLGPKSPKLKKGRIFIKKVAVCVLPNISEFISDPTFPREQQKSHLFRELSAQRSVNLRTYKFRLSA